jgi:transmembrane sensor
VRAIGTAFSVRFDGAEVAVLVTEGKVEISREPRAADVQSAAAGAPRRLVAGERISVRRDEPAAKAKIERVAGDALHAAIRWHSQVMTFSDLPLREVVAQFNRRNEIQLVFAEPELGERKIGGTFAADQVEAFARLLAQDGDMVAERRGAREIVLRRAP